MSHSLAANDPASLGAKSRRSSISAIPRPISGTSRHATPIGNLPGRKDSPVREATLEKPPTHRKSWQPNHGLAPTSFRASHLQVSPTEYSLPYKQRLLQDLSGTQQQLCIRNLSTHSLNDPEHATNSHHLKPASSTNALPKSKTMSSLLSPSRDTAPGRRLLQPIGPPLPRTQTLGNISCFTPSGQTPSPRKPKSVSFSPPRQVDDATSQMDIVDVLVESRMTEKEMDLMLQVQREAAANRARIRNAHQLRNSSQHGAPDVTTANKDEQTPSLTPNDTAKAKTQEVTKRRSSSGRLLYINPTLANKNWQHCDPPTTTTLTSIGSVTSSEPSQCSENDPRHVHIAQPTAYWTGRYVSLCDRFRMAELSRPTPSPSETNEKQIDRLFESSEKIRINSALTELRDHCKTAEALKSFEEFEGSLLKRTGMSRQSLRRALVTGANESDKGLSTSRTMPLAVGAPTSPGNASSPMSCMSSVNAEAVLTGASKAFYGERNMAKSKTTGNLASLIPAIPKRQHFLNTGPTQQPQPSATQRVSHRIKTSYFDCSPETRAKAMKEREERAARRAAEVLRRSGSQITSMDGPFSRKASGKAAVGAKPALPQHVSYNSKVSRFDQVGSSLSAGALESGHGLPPPLVAATTMPSRVEVVYMSGGEKEKVIKSRRRAERQFSGERVKSLLGAGVREVKKMGRRVSGMSWPGSGDD